MCTPVCGERKVEQDFSGSTRHCLFNMRLAFAVLSRFTVEAHPWRGVLWGLVGNSGTIHFQSKMGEGLILLAR